MPAAKIRAKARDLGFTAVGIAPADPLEGAQFYARWLAMGYAGEMHYLARHRDKRIAPAQLVPGAQSAICLAMDYCQPEPTEPTPLHGQIATYARGDDYHDLIKKRLFILWDWIRETAGETTQGRVYVDTAPVLERELAQRAGLGWWGKNTCLIDKRKGSYFFLAEIITDLKLPRDEPAPDHCGTCTRCLDACPTEAFPEPYVLDSSKCISYLTIEHRGDLPVEMENKLSGWVYGCDICQEVCPWNIKFVQDTTEQRFLKKQEIKEMNNDDWESLDYEKYKKLFKDSAIKRTKFEGLSRNIKLNKKIIN